MEYLFSTNILKSLSKQYYPKRMAQLIHCETSCSEPPVMVLSAWVQFSVTAFKRHWKHLKFSNAETLCCKSELLPMYNKMFKLLISYKHHFAKHNGAYQV